MSDKTAFLFPAFAMKFKDAFHREEIDGYPEEVEHFAHLAAQVVHLDRQQFDCVDQSEPGDDLQAHYKCYVDNCAFGSLVAKHMGPCDLVAGYSMGLFSALYHCGTVSFEEGLMMMHRIYQLANEAVPEGEYGMGFIVGLTPEEIASVICAHGPGVEIADVCGKRVVFTAGRREDVEAVLDASVTEGCLQAKLVPVRLPFHSSYLKQVEGRARRMLENAIVSAPSCGIVSCISQAVLHTADDVRQEVAANVAHPMNWFKTMHRLLDLGATLLVECGPSDSLANLATRNIKRPYTIYHCRQFDRLFASLGAE